MARLKAGPYPKSFPGALHSGAAKPVLLAEVRTHDGKVIFRQAAHDFLLKVVATGRGRTAVALLKRGAALFNVFFQAIVEVLVAAALGHLRLVVELDLIHQQAGKAL